MEVKNKMGPVRDKEPPSWIDPLQSQGLELFEKGGEVDNDAVANDRNAGRID
jgi:hypothetical protein